MQRTKLLSTRASLMTQFEALETRRMLASTFTATLEPLNNSGVSGTALLTLDGDMLTVTIDARGLEANQVHPQHIHGQFTRESGSDAGGDNAKGTPSDSALPAQANDADNDGFVEHDEAGAVTGPAILPLTAPPADETAAGPLNFPTAGADGTISFTETYDLSISSQFFDPESRADFVGSDLLPLPLRVVELHGMTVQATAGASTTGEVNGTEGYKADLPVAVGKIVLQSEGGDDTGGDTGGDDSGADLSGIFQAQADAGESAQLPVAWTTRDALFDNEVGFFLTDADGSINGIAPADDGWAEAALRSQSRTILFASGSGAGASTDVTVNASDRVVFYIIQNNTTEKFLEQNAANQVGSGPLAFFSIARANPDQQNHVRFTTSTTTPDGTNEMRWEDLTGLGDADFNDVVFTVNLRAATASGTGDGTGTDTGSGGGDSSGAGG